MRDRNEKRLTAESTVSRKAPPAFGEAVST
jgi:hypothetical protein